MKVIIAGGRDFSDYELFKAKLCYYLSRLINIEIISGRCDDHKKGIHTFTTDDGIKVYGADGLGEKWAKENGYRVIPFSADWSLYGNSAGPIRNRLMGKHGTHLISAWNGKSSGTKDMINVAKEFNLPTRIVYY